LASGNSLFVKATYTNTYSFVCKFGVGNNTLTYYSTHPRNLNSWVSCTVIYTTAIVGPSIKLGIHKFINGVLTVSGNGATVTVTTPTAHHLQTGMVIQMLGWTGTGTFNGLYVITVTSTTSFTYSASGNGTPSVTGTCGVLYSIMEVRLSNQNEPFHFTTNAYIEHIVKDDVFSLYLCNTEISTITVQVRDVCWLITS
jgi:hypothetical protein